MYYKPLATFAKLYKFGYFAIFASRLVMRDLKSQIIEVFSSVDIWKIRLEGSCRCCQSVEAIKERADFASRQS